jgi:nucleoside-triphosphatase
VFNTKGVEILQNSFDNREVFILNEIGFLESKASRFTEEVIKLLDSSKVVIALVKGISCSYIDLVLARKDIKLFEVNEENRKTMKDAIVELLKAWKVPVAEN